MRRCLLRWPDERFFPRLKTYERRLIGFSSNLRFLRVIINDYFVRSLISSARNFSESPKKPDDHFVRSHGIATPDAFWKLVVRGMDRVIAWIIPNAQEATYTRLDQYLVSVEELERQTGERFPEVPAFLRGDKPEVSWIVPIGCDKR